MDVHISVERKTARLDQGVINTCKQSTIRQHLDKRALTEIWSKLSQSSIKTNSYKINSSTLHKYSRKYSEQLVFDPIKQISHYFQKRGGTFVSRSFPRLYYYPTAQNTSPSKSAVAAIGEATAALIAKREFGIKHVARPINDFPDILLGDKPLTKLFLVEAKGGIQTKIEGTMKKELVRLAMLVAGASGMGPWDVTGLLIGTQIEQVNKYKCIIYQIELI